MPTDEERAAIMAEYMAGADNDEEPEEDVDALEDDESDGGEFGDEEEEEEPQPNTILKGGLSTFQDKDGKDNLLYSGTWSFVGDEESGGKFKMSSPLSAPFDYTAPAASYPFEGYFIIKNDDGSKAKVPETSVIMNITPVPGKEGKRWTIKASGANQFGTFNLEGEYRVKKGQEAENKLHCEKKYEAKAGGGGGGGESDSADEDFDDEEEVQGPDEDAGLSVEELRAKYAKAGEAAEGEPAAKKQKKEEEEVEDF
ncbi:hypothetical protein TeGR_g8658 [Tetraparma gracilis]|uniref:Uncharacterized protein n=1 Tax=Tetraparma gracilis TaxID=2962635 RepID=A0ABQ6MQP9_9STRA|nr:hypothetical protein TeGR_g8658 [Tetraparma gracilis]